MDEALQGALNHMAAMRDAGQFAATHSLRNHQPDDRLNPIEKSTMSKKPIGLPQMSVLSLALCAVLAHAQSQPRPPDQPQAEGAAALPPPLCRCSVCLISARP